MSSCRSALLAAACALAALCAQAERFPGIGRAATPAEVRAWDIDVRPDFKGLPAGSGSVAQGQDVWEAKCASCHGVFGESNQVFSPLMGGTTAADVQSGRVKRLTEPDYPVRSTLMKVPTLSTLWDYINRAMPWNAPKSLSADEIYAVTAFMLNVSGVVDDNFVLSDNNIRAAQARMPNRKGMTTAHALWPGTEFRGLRRPDVQAPRCMRDCPVEAKVASFLPDYARDAHGNLAQQNRLVGAQRGADTSRPAPTVAPAANSAPAAASATALTSTPAAAAAATATPASAAHSGDAVAAAELSIKKNNCFTCHAANTRLLGPGWKEIARKHSGKNAYLAEKIRTGGGGVWGAIPMPPQSISSAEAQAIAQWLAVGAP